MVVKTKTLGESVSIRDSFSYPIRQDNLIKDVWKHFYMILKNHIDDPKNRSVRLVWGQYPDQDMDGKNSYPVIVIPSVGYSSNEFSIGLKRTIQTYDVNVIILSDKNYMTDQLSDNILNEINKEKNMLSEAGLQLKPSDSDTQVLTNGDLKIYSRTMTFPITVSHKR